MPRPSLPPDPLDPWWLDRLMTGRAGIPDVGDEALTEVILALRAPAEPGELARRQEYLAVFAAVQDPSVTREVAAAGRVGWGRSGRVGSGRVVSERVRSGRRMLIAAAAGAMLAGGLSAYARPLLTLPGSEAGDRPGTPSGVQAVPASSRPAGGRSGGLDRGGGRDSTGTPAPSGWYGRTASSTDTMQGTLPWSPPGVPTPVQSGPPWKLGQSTKATKPPTSGPSSATAATPAGPAAAAPTADSAKKASKEASKEAKAAKVKKARD